jgi:hypothetical protein
VPTRSDASNFRGLIQYSTQGEDKFVFMKDLHKNLVVRNPGPLFLGLLLCGSIIDYTVSLRSYLWTPDIRKIPFVNGIKPMLFDFTHSMTKQKRYPKTIKPVPQFKGIYKILDMFIATYCNHLSVWGHGTDLWNFAQFFLVVVLIACLWYQL